MANAPQMSEDEEDQLVDALAAALDTMVDASCPDMAPLWFKATRAARRLLRSSIPRCEAPLPERLLAASKAMRSKYGALAAWRHAALWQGCLEELDAGDRETLVAIYFTACENRPPYAWSRSAARCPALPAGANPSWVKERAVCAAEDVLNQLKARAVEQDGSVRGELVQRLLKVATRDTLDDVLKITDHDPGA
jgi:hypothetical protein